MKFLNLSFFVKGAMAVFAFLLMSNLSSAQTLTITNSTSCEKIVEVFTFQGCVAPAAFKCSTTVVVPSGVRSAVYSIATLCGNPPGTVYAIGHVNVFPGGNCGLSAPLPRVSMGIPGCVPCPGPTWATGSYMNGGTTINATTSCTGGGNATLVIW